MTEIEIMDLIRHRKDTNTYYAQCGGYGFHGTDLFKVAEHLIALICLMPGCCNKRCEQAGRLSYLCVEHYEEACKEEVIYNTRKSTGLLLAEPDWNSEALNSRDADNVDISERDP